MGLSLMNPDDKMNLWLQQMKAKEAAPIPGISMPNSQAISEQPSPGVDPATLAQPATLPPAPMLKPPLPQLAKGQAKLTAQDAIRGFISDAADSEASGISRSIDAGQVDVDKIKEQLAQYSAQPQQMDFSPLAALTDAWTGSKFAQTYKAPQTSQDRMETMAKLQGMATQREGDLSQQKTALLNSKIKAQQDILASEKEDMANARIKSTQMQLDQNTHNQMLRVAKTDPVFGRILDNTRKLSTAWDFIGKAKVTTKQQFMETQQIVRRQLGIVGTSSADERDKTMLDSLGLKGAEVEQYLYGVPVDVKGVAGEYLEHLKDLISITKDNNRVQADSQMAAMISGNPDLYERRKDLKKGLEQYASTSMKRFTEGAMSAPIPGAAPVTGPAPAGVATTADAEAKKKADRIAELLAKKGS